MGKCISLRKNHGRRDDKRSLSFPLPNESSFCLPSPLPDWPPGDGFASGSIDLGGIEVIQITSFTKIWASQDGGPGHNGVTLYEPSTIPNGYFFLGSYAQPNNKPLFGWTLVGKDLTNGPSRALVEPIDYTLVWTSQSLTIKQSGPVYIWLPTPPDGYKAVGLVVTTSSVKPQLDKIRCLRSNFTEESESSNLIWNSSGLNIFVSKPKHIGVQQMGVSLGTFTTTKEGNSASPITTCLKNTKSNLSYMPNLAQIKTLIQAYAPYIYLHPNENFSPSSVNWFFANGALLYKKGDERNPVPIQQDGANLPSGGANDGSFWIDLPTNDNEKQRIKKGSLETAMGYVHIKPMLGATFTDLATWVFYPFNGPARAKVGFIKSLPLGKIGEHTGDWEHMTLRISNFNGELRSVYFSQHSKGVWLDASELEFELGNRVVGYASLNGHAMYPKAGVEMQGSDVVGIRNDAARSGRVVDVAARHEVISADYEVGVSVPPWVDYTREWGPRITYDAGKAVERVARWLPRRLRADLEKVVRSLPAEMRGEEGPTGPKVKRNWYGDEA